MAGIQQTDEAVRAGAAMAVFVIKAREGGYGFGDLRAAMEDTELRSKVVAGIRDVQAVPGEIADVDLREIVQVSLGVLDELGIGR